MDILEFCKKVENSLADYIGNGAVTSTEKKHKNNGVVSHGITVKEKGINAAIYIYVDKLYEAYKMGKPFSEVMKEVICVYQENRMVKNIDMGFFLDYEGVKERVCYRVVGVKGNQELLKQIPYIPYLDMAVTFYCDVPELDGKNRGTVQINNRCMEKWGITKEKLYQDAIRNTRRIHPHRLLSMDDVMQDIFGQDPCQAETDIGTDMYILGNRENAFGAAVMLYEGVLDQPAEAMGSFKLLPR